MKIGDYVKIIRPGGMYDTYDEMAKIMGLKNWTRSDKIWYIDKLTHKTDPYNVIGIQTHTRFKSDTAVVCYVAIRNIYSGREYLFDQDAVEQYELKDLYKELIGKSVTAQCDAPDGGAIKKGESAEIIEGLRGHFPSLSTYMLDLCKLFDSKYYKVSRTQPKVVTETHDSESEWYVPKVGDLLKINQPKRKDGYPGTWISDMNESVGKVFKVSTVRKREGGYYIKFENEGGWNYFWPENAKDLEYHHMELVTDEVPQTISEDCPLKVGDIIGIDWLNDLSASDMDELMSKWGIKHTGSGMNFREVIQCRSVNQNCEIRRASPARLVYYWVSMDPTIDAMYLLKRHHPKYQVVCTDLTGDDTYIHILPQISTYIPMPVLERSSKSEPNSIRITNNKIKINNLKSKIYGKSIKVQRPNLKISGNSSIRGNRIDSARG